MERLNITELNCVDVFVVYCEFVLEFNFFLNGFLFFLNDQLFIIIQVYNPTSMVYSLEFLKMEVENIKGKSFRSKFSNIVL